MKSKREKIIALAYNDITIKGVSLLFQYLYSLKSPFIYTYTKNQDTLIVSDKKKDETIELNINYDQVEKKFYDWCKAKQNKIILTYTLEESVVFIAVCNVAYCQINKDKNASEVHKAGVGLIYKTLFGYLKVDIPIH